MVEKKKTTAFSKRPSMHNKKLEEKEIIKKLDQMKCPRCKRDGVVVWVSKDKKQVGIRCPASHNYSNRGPSKYGSALRLKSRSRRNMVFIKQILP